MSYASSTEELSRWSRIQNGLASHVMHENPYSNLECLTSSPGCPICLSTCCSINHVKSLHESFHNWGTLPREQQTAIVENMYSSVPLLRPFARYTRQELNNQIVSLFRQKFSRLSATYTRLLSPPCNIDLIVAGLDMTQIPQNIVDQATLLALSQVQQSESRPNNVIADVLTKHGTTSTSAPTTSTSSSSAKVKQKRASIATKLSEDVAFDADWLIHDALQAKRERKDGDHTDISAQTIDDNDGNSKKDKGIATAMSDWCVVSLTVTRYLRANASSATTATVTDSCPNTGSGVRASDGENVINMARKMGRPPGKAKTKDEELVTETVIYEKNVLIRNSMAYRSGYLAFREAVPVLSMLLDLYKTHMEINDMATLGKTSGNFSFSGFPSNPHYLWPDVIVIDGNGVLHPHKCGLASHVGVLLNTPTVGVGKTLCHVELVNKDADECAREIVARYRCALTATDGECGCAGSTHADTGSHTGSDTGLDMGLDMGLDKGLDTGGGHASGNYHVERPVTIHDRGTDINMTENPCTHHANASSTTSTKSGDTPAMSARADVQATRIAIDLTPDAHNKRHTSAGSTTGTGTYPPHAQAHGGRGVWALPVQAGVDAYLSCSEALLACTRERYRADSHRSVADCADNDAHHACSRAEADAAVEMRLNTSTDTPAAAVATTDAIDADADACMCPRDYMDAPAAESSSVGGKSSCSQANNGSNGSHDNNGNKPREKGEACIPMEPMDINAGQQPPVPAPVPVLDRRAYVDRKSLAELLSVHATALLWTTHGSGNSECSGKDTETSIGTGISRCDSIGTVSGKLSCREANPEDKPCGKDELFPHLMAKLPLLPPPCYPLLGKPTYIPTSTRKCTLTDNSACTRTRTNTGVVAQEKGTADDTQIETETADSRVNFLYGMGVHANWLHAVQTILLARLKDEEKRTGNSTRTQASISALLDELCNVPRTAPVYVSIGSHIHMREALLLVLGTSVVKVPEATRSADMIGRACVRELRDRIDAGDETVINKRK